MPKSRELQFAAMAVMQSYVKSFEQRMRLAIVQPTGAPLEDTDFILRYSLTMSPEDQAFFWHAGVRFAEPPQRDPVVNPALVLDFSDEIVLPIVEATNKHVCQVYGMLCGVEDLPFPVVPKLRPRLATDIRGGVWGALPGVVLSLPFGTGRVLEIEGTALLKAKDEDFTGVVGLAGWETYLSCTKGIPTIEILPEGRGRTWLSKWANPLYRAISHEGAQENLQHYCNQARHNLELVCAYLAERERMKIT